MAEKDLSASQVEVLGAFQYTLGHCYEAKGRGVFLPLSIISSDADLFSEQQVAGKKTTYTLKKEMVSVEFLTYLEEIATDSSSAARHKFESFFHAHGTHVVSELTVEDHEGDERIVAARIAPHSTFVQIDLRERVERMIQEYIMIPPPVYVFVAPQDSPLYYYTIQADLDTKELVLVNTINPDMVHALVSHHQSSQEDEEEGNQSGDEDQDRPAKKRRTESKPRERRSSEKREEEYEDLLGQLQALTPSAIVKEMKPLKDGLQGSLSSVIHLAAEGKKFIANKHGIVLGDEGEFKDEEADMCFDSTRNDKRIASRLTRRFWAIKTGTGLAEPKIRLTSKSSKAVNVKFVEFRGLVVLHDDVSGTKRSAKPKTEDSQLAPGETSSDEEQDPAADFGKRIEDHVGAENIKFIEQSLLSMLSLHSGYLFDAVAIVTEIKEFRGFPIPLIDYCLSNLASKGSLTFETHNGIDVYGFAAGDENNTTTKAQNNRLFIRPVPKEYTKERVLADLQATTKGAMDVILHYDPADMTKNRGFAFVDYDSSESATAAFKKIVKGEVLVGGQICTGDWATPSNEPSSDVMAQVKIVFARYLPLDTTEDTIFSVFGKYGEIEKIRRARDFCFVHYTDRAAALESIKQLNNTKIGTNTIEVMLAKPLNPTLRQQYLMNKFAKFGGPSSYSSGPPGFSYRGRGGFRPSFPRGGYRGGYNSYGGRGGYRTSTFPPRGRGMGPYRGGGGGYIRPPAGASPTPPENRKSKLCEFFLKGICNKGANCTFAHGEHELIAPNYPPRGGYRGGYNSNSSYRGRPSHNPYYNSPSRPSQSSPSSSGYYNTPSKNPYNSGQSTTPRGEYGDNRSYGYDSNYPPAQANSGYYSSYPPSSYPGSSTYPAGSYPPPSTPASSSSRPPSQGGYYPPPPQSYPYPPSGYYSQSPQLPSDAKGGRPNPPANNNNNSGNSSGYYNYPPY